MCLQHCIQVKDSFFFFSEKKGNWGRFTTHNTTDVPDKTSSPPIAWKPNPLGETSLLQIITDLICVRAGLFEIEMPQDITCEKHCP